MLVVGTPSACFLPAHKHSFTYVSEMKALTVPIRGEYPSGAPREGQFDICPQPGAIMFGTLLEVLFGFSVYPKLESGQMFVISGLDMGEDEISVVGRIIQFS